LDNLQVVGNELVIDHPYHFGLVVVGGVEFEKDIVQLKDFAKEEVLFILLLLLVFKAFVEVECIYELL
jgi:hypothetical protein